MNSDDLNQNLWERYGFAGDPFETGPLPINYGSGLSVGTAYVERTGRLNPGTVLRNFLRNPRGGRIVVEGTQGVGKTTFVNFHRYEWSRTKKGLLSPVTPVSVESGWSETRFLLSLLSALSARMRLEMDEQAVAKDALMREVATITGVKWEKDGGVGFNISVLGSGGGVQTSGQPKVSASNLTALDLREYLHRLDEKARKALNVSGVIFHLDNLELLKREGEAKLRDFFDDIRDAIQEPHVFFIFVGYTGMFQNTIVPNARVRSIFFDKPLHLKPLSLEQVHDLISVRYKLLAAPGKTIIKPVEDAVIDHLYATFQAKLRPIMNAITSLVSHLPDSVAQTIGLEQATGMLREILLDELESTLTETEMEVFQAAVALGRFTPTALAKQTGKSKQLIQKHLKKLLELRYVQHGEKAGRSQHYEADARFHLIVPVES